MAALRSHKTVYSTASQSTIQKLKKKHRPPFLFRALRAVVVTVVLCCGAYMGAWLYLSRQVEQQISSVLQQMVNPQHAVQLQFSAVHAEGFPFALEYRLHDVRVTSQLASLVRENTVYKAELTPETPLLFRIDLLGNRATLSFPQHAAFDFNGVARQYHWKLDFANAGLVQYQLDTKRYPNLLVALLFGNIADWREGMLLASRVEYRDGGAVLKDGQGTLLASIAPSEVTLVHTQDDQKAAFSLTAQTENLRFEPALMSALFSGVPTSEPSVKDFAEYMIAQQAQTQSLAATLKADITLEQQGDIIQQPKVAIRVHQLAAANKLYAINSDADVTLEAKDLMMPTGWLRMQWVNHPALLSHIRQVNNAIVAMGLAPYFAQHADVHLAVMSPEDTARIQQMMVGWGEATEDPKNLLVMAQRESGGTLRIGTKPWLDVVMELKQPHPVTSVLPVAESDAVAEKENRKPAKSAASH